MKTISTILMIIIQQMKENKNDNLYNIKVIERKH